MIIVPILILMLIILAKFRNGMLSAFLILVATKSIVDAFWDVKLGFLSILSIQGLLIPILFFGILKKRKVLPKFWLRTANIYIIALSFGVIWGFFVKPISSIETIFLNINSYIGFFLMPILISDQKAFKKLLFAIMICGIFPIVVSVFQFQTGIIFQERETVGITRYVGFYHDAFPVRFYGLMTLLSVLIYFSIFKTKSKLLFFAIICIAMGALFSVYLIFSKAAVGIIGLWVVLLMLFSKSRIKQSFSIGLGALVLFLIFGDVFYDNIGQLFSKEVGFQSGEVRDVRYTLAGRGYIWQEAWEFWIYKQTAFFQWVGDGINRPVHNEFLRILMVNGIIGLIFIILFVLTMIKNIFKIHKVIRVYGFMLFGMYIIDCIGLVPGVYYYYNIVVWGTIGLLLLRPHLFIKQ